MNRIKDGGFAFPSQAETEPNGEYSWREYGMTIRDYFAAAALPSLLRIYVNDVDHGRMGFNVTERAYELADAMIKARES